MYSMAAVVLETGLTAHTVRAWERRYAAVQPRRDESGRRSYSAADVERLRLLKRATELGHPIRKLAGLNSDELGTLLATVRSEEAGDPATSAFRRSLLAAVEQYDVVGCERQLRLALATLPAVSLVQQVLVPALREIGERWFAGEVTVAQERLFTSTVVRTVQAMLDRLSGGRGAPKLVFATLPGERHTTGALLAGYFAATRGATVHFVGSELPPDALARLALAWRCDAVCVSVVLASAQTDARSRLRELAGELDGRIPIWVGGSGVDSIRDAQGAAPEGCAAIASVQELLVRLDALAVGAHPA
ncbi:MAG: MerR family transcriptional regulator [Gammaproteobacteria bacterium]